MNPDGDKNQNNFSGTPNADPTQQAVFTPNSAPQPAVPAQKQQVITGSVVEPVSTGLSHQYYSNHPTKTSPTITGDIVINKGKRPRRTFNKKLLIFAGAALVLVIVLVLIISNIISNNIPKAFESSFKAYASYLLYEDPTDTTWTETNQSDDYMTMQNYSLYQQFYEPGHTEYFNTLTNYFNKFVSKYNSMRGRLGSITEFIDQYIENYRVLDTLSKAPAFDYDSMEGLLEESGESGVRSWVENNFSSLKNSETGKEYYDMVQEYAELIISGEDNIATWEKTDSLYSKLILTQSYLVNSLQQGCWEIWEIIMEQNNA